MRSKVALGGGPDAFGFAPGAARCDTPGVRAHFLRDTFVVPGPEVHANAVAIRALHDKPPASIVVEALSVRRRRGEGGTAASVTVDICVAIGSVCVPIVERN